MGYTQEGVCGSEAPGRVAWRLQRQVSNASSPLMQGTHTCKTIRVGLQVAPVVQQHIAPLPPLLHSQATTALGVAQGSTALGATLAMVSYLWHCLLSAPVCGVRRVEGNRAGQTHDTLSPCNDVTQQVPKLQLSQGAQPAAASSSPPFPPLPLPLAPPISTSAHPQAQAALSITIRLPKGVPGQVVMSPQLIVAKKTFTPPNADDSSTVYTYIYEYTYEHI